MFHVLMTIVQKPDSSTAQDTAHVEMESGPRYPIPTLSGSFRPIARCPAPPQSVYLLILSE